MKLDSKTSNQDDDSKEIENITLLVKKFGKFLKKDKTIIFGQRSKFAKRRETSTRKFTKKVFTNDKLKLNVLRSLLDNGNQK